MNENILVIGNGFDLAHGMNTKYDDFISYLNKKEYLADEVLKDDEKEKIIASVEKNGFIKYFLKLVVTVPGWVDFEKELYRIVQEFKVLFQEYKTFFPVGNANFLNERAISELLYELLFDFGILVKTSGYTEIAECFYSSKYGIYKREILRKLKDNLDELINILEIYLLSCQRKMQNEQENVKKKQIEIINPKYIITFNYTNTYQLYAKNYDDVLHIHGELQKGNMILGFNDEEDTDLDFIYFKKYFQRIQKKTETINSKKIYNFISGVPTLSIIHFYGHSMDKTDEDIIVKLQSMAKKFVIYIYNQEDYEQKVVNLISVFGKEKAVKMIEEKFIEFVQCE